MSYQDCISAIRKAAGGILSDDDLTDIVEQIQKRYRRRKAENPLEDERKALADIAKGIADEEKLAALIEKRSRAINVLRKKQRLDFYSRFEGNEAHALSTLMVGSEKEPPKPTSKAVVHDLSQKLARVTYEKREGEAVAIHVETKDGKALAARIAERLDGTVEGKAAVIPERRLPELLGDDLAKRINSGPTSGSFEGPDIKPKRRSATQAAPDDLSGKLESLSYVKLEDGRLEIQAVGKGGRALGGKIAERLSGEAKGSSAVVPMNKVSALLGEGMAQRIKEGPTRGNFDNVDLRPPLELPQFVGAGRSVAAEQRGLRADLMGPMMAELRATNLIDIIGARNPEIERDIARNMWAITEAELAKKPAKLSGTKEAQDAARIFTKYQEAARQMQNDAGAWIGRLPGYIVKQSHDMFRIRRAGYEAWRETILPRLDPKVFDSVDNPEDFLRTIWTELSTGEHYRERGADDYLGGFKGPGNLGKKLSQHRTLHFKSADDWLAYNDQFGHGGLVEAVISGLTKAADNTALMRTWGPNPEAAFLADMTQLREQAARRGDSKQNDRLKSWRLLAEFDQITGAANVPGNPTWAQRGAFTRALINMSSLGGVVLSSIPDNALKAAVLKHHGIGFLEGHADALADLVRGRQKGEARAIADGLAAGIDGMVGNLAARWSATDTLPGKTARMQNWFFRLNFMSWWQDAKSTGTGLMMANNLAKSADKEFGALDPLLQTTLRRYGIQEDQWAALRKADMRLDGDTPYLMPEAINLLPDSVIMPLARDGSEKSLQRARDDLRIGLRTFYAEELAAVNTWGGAKERAIATWGTNPGTPLGETVRFLMQFKLFPITFATKHLAREFNRGGVPGMVHLILATTALGYLANSAKQLAKGKEPKPLDNYKTWIAAAQQGGGLGIYGDFLFGEYNRFGGGVLETLAGPAVGKVSEVLRAFGDVKEGEPADALAKTVKAGIGTLPGVNLFYTRAALDYFLLYQMQEWASPGYLRRMERRIEKDNGQKFILPPSSQIPYGGGTRMFEGVR